MRPGLLCALLLAACGGDETPQVPVPGRPGALKSAPEVRAQRRAYDGAPPTIPHGDDFGAACVNCHTGMGLNLPGVGFSPPMPHAETAGLSAVALCTQCHVYRRTEEVFRRNDFAGLRQDLRQGRRATPLAPPVMPHPVFMRENCGACHSGPAAREEVRCPHPERVRCAQCHVEQRTTEVWTREP